MLLHGTISTIPPPSIQLLKSQTYNNNLKLKVCVASSSQVPTAEKKLKISISNEELESRGFFLKHYIEDLNLDHLNSVFVAVGFPRRDPEKIRVALENIDTLLWIKYYKTQRPMAFARATGDGIFNTIIWDVVVDPSFQGIELGKVIMERLLEELLQKGISNIALYSELRVLGFYKPQGFAADPDGIRGMGVIKQGRHRLHLRLRLINTIGGEELEEEKQEVMTSETESSSSSAAGSGGEIEMTEKLK